MWLPILSWRLVSLVDGFGWESAHKEREDFVADEEEFWSGRWGYDRVLCKSKLMY